LRNVNRSGGTRVPVPAGFAARDRTTLRVVSLTFE
jgi:hypothetical protein